MEGEPLTYWGGITEGESWKCNHGGIQKAFGERQECPRGIHMALRVTQKTPRRQPGGMQEAPRKHPGDTQEAPSLGLHP